MQRILFAAVLLLRGAQAALAWGDLAHQRVMAAAIDNAPEPLRSYFQARRLYFVEHASEPDKLAHEDPVERAHHYTEIEGYGRAPFRSFQRRFVSERWNPPPSERTYGDSIWQIERYTLKLSDDFRRRRWQDADHDAVFAAHYAADLAQPLHTVMNYDGQQTKQLGVHARFEAELVNDFAAGWKLRPAPAMFIPDLRARIFHELIESYTRREEVFSADREAVAGGGYLSPQFMTRFERKAGPLAVRQLDEAATFVSSLWITAWVRAGKPALPRLRSEPH